MLHFIFCLTRRIELAAFEPGELGLPHVALHHGVKVLEPVELGARDPTPELIGLKSAKYIHRELLEIGLLLLLFQHLTMTFHCIQFSLCTIFRRALMKGIEG